MANTLTDLYPDLYAALNVVSRERAGFLRAVSMNGAEALTRAAKDQTIRVPIVPASSPSDTTPAVTPPDTGDDTVTNVQVTISKSKHDMVRWGGEEVKGLDTAGTYGSINQDRVAEVMRALINEMEADVAALYTGASRGYGTAGTAPFGTAGDLTDIAEVLRILEENGAPQSNLHLVLGSNAWAKLRGKQSTLFRVNESGTDELLREGRVGRLQSFDLHQSAQVKTHTAGTGTLYQSNNVAGYAVGATSIAIDTGSGTVLAGDLVTFAGDAHKYQVATGVAAPGTIVLAKPGLRETLADNVAMSIVAAYEANMAFHRGAIAMGTRLPAVGPNGDAAVDRVVIQDPVTGIAFEASLYPQFRQVGLFIGIAWGQGVVKSDHLALLIG